MSARRVLVVHGPNLDLLGTREPGIYGAATLADIDAGLARRAKELGAEVECFQSNHEGAILDRLHEARGRVDGIVINPAGLTHTSVVLRDALLAVDVPFVEVHLSNVHAREPFRQRSLLADVARGVVCGLGPAGYRLALEGLLATLESSA